MRVARLVCSIAVGFALIPGIARAAEYLGAETCRTCHEKEYAQWRASGHAGALGRLSAVQQRDKACRSCHTMAPAEDDPALSGVQCESCHGPGVLYAPRYVMRDKVLARLLGLRDITEEVCVRCHAPDAPSITPFKLAEKIDRVRHGPKKAAEPQPKEAPAEKKTESGAVPGPATHRAAP